MSDNCIMLPNGECYDPRVAQDHTGLQFVTQGKGKVRDPRRDARNFMREPAWLSCPNCAADNRFMVLAESHPMGDGMAQIFCGKCHTSWPVVQMMQPQMNNRIARELGMPEQQAALDFEIDLSDLEDYR